MFSDLAAPVPVQLDMASLVGDLAWPVVVLILVLIFGGRLLGLFGDLAPRVKSLSLGGVTLELATATPLPAAAQGAVDLRRTGQSSDVDDSTLRSFYEQMYDTSRVDYVVVDLGEGQEWLSSRLYILSVLLSRMRGLQVIVLVETAGPVRRRLVGLAESDSLRWKLAAAYPWFEAAFSQATSTLWGLPQAPNPNLEVVNDEGRLEQCASAEPAAQLLRSFLDAIQIPGPTPPPGEEENWVSLPSDPNRLEHAIWLQARDLEPVLGESLVTASLPLSLLQSKSKREQAALILDQPGPWVAATREDRVFDRLIDRRRIERQLARQSAPGPD